MSSMQILMLSGRGVAGISTSTSGRRQSSPTSSLDMQSSERSCLRKARGGEQPFLSTSGIVAVACRRARSELGDWNAGAETHMSRTINRRSTDEAMPALPTIAPTRPPEFGLQTSAIFCFLCEKSRSSQLLEHTNPRPKATGSDAACRLLRAMRDHRCLSACRTRMCCG